MNEIITIISAGASICAIVVFLVNILRSKIKTEADKIELANDFKDLLKTFKDFKEEVKNEFKAFSIEQQTMIIKIENITSEVAYLKASLQELKGLGERVVTVEQSVKAAHKRLDEISKKRGSKDE
jgi:acetate kinase